jgi:hypothetical protein
MKIATALLVKLRISYSYKGSTALASRELGIESCANSYRGKVQAKANTKNQLVKQTTSLIMQICLLLKNSSVY